MDWLWTHGGRYFGYRADDEFRTYDGRHAGRFEGDDVYGPAGSYLGELRNERLVTCLAKKRWASSRFSPYGQRGGYVPYADYVGFGCAWATRTSPDRKSLETLVAEGVPRTG